MESAAGQMQLAIRSPVQEMIQSTFVAIHNHLVQHESCPMQVELEEPSRKRTKSDGGSKPKKKVRR
tara:strand:+ start:742 stop:939 length:198 start_codon:yes stop_codon:yes gene_type:complete